MKQTFKQRKSVIVRLRKKGWKFREICEKFGITRQRAEQIFNGTRWQDQGLEYVRGLVRKRDKYICQKCLKKWRVGSRQFDVHHLNGVCGRKSKGVDKIEDMLNLTTLCHKCHLNLEEVRYKMSTKSSPRPDKFSVDNRNL